MPQAHIEGAVQLTVQSLNEKQTRSERDAAAAYNVPRSTTQRRRAETQSRRGFQPNSKKLAKLEEETVVRHALEPDTRS